MQQRPQHDVAEEDVVGGGAHAGQLLQRDECHVVEEHAHHAEPHLRGHQHPHLLLHLATTGKNI